MFRKRSLRWSSHQIVQIVQIACKGWGRIAKKIPAIISQYRNFAIHRLFFHWGNPRHQKNTPANKPNRGKQKQMRKVMAKNCSWKWGKNWNVKHKTERKKLLRNTTRANTKLYDDKTQKILYITKGIQM